MGGIIVNIRGILKIGLGLQRRIKMSKYIMGFRAAIGQIRYNLVNLENAPHTQNTDYDKLIAWCDTTITLLHNAKRMLIYFKNTQEANKQGGPKI